MISHHASQLRRQDSFGHCSLAAACLLLLVLSPVVSAASPQQVNDASDRGVKYIHSRQKNGNWEQGPKNWARTITPA